MTAPGVIAGTIDSLQEGVQVRVAETLPVKLLIADCDLALVALGEDQDGEPGAVLLHRSGLLAGLQALFETLWRYAYPLEVDKLAVEGQDILDHADGGLAMLDRKILALLLSGLSDASVAANLGMSLRTLQRRLRHLIDLAGVETRMQLGWHAGRNGWA